MQKFGFTLAEVLITLMIIGVVAALTIPSVISNYQQQEFKTGLKKAVSVLNSAIQMNISQDGETPYDNSNLFGYLQRHMNIIKTARINHCYNGDTGELVVLNDDQEQCTHAGAGPAQNMAFYTTDGMRFEILTFLRNRKKEHFILHESGYELLDRDFSIGCGSYGLSSNSNNTVNPPCVILVDVNGDKKPNPPSEYREFSVENPYSGGNQSFEYTYPSPTDKKLSDIFSIMITDEKAIPFGVVAQRAMYSK